MRKKNISFSSGLKNFLNRFFFTIDIIFLKQILVQNTGRNKDKFDKIKLLSMWEKSTSIPVNDYLLRQVKTNTIYSSLIF